MKIVDEFAPYNTEVDEITMEQYQETFKKIYVLEDEYNLYKRKSFAPCIGVTYEGERRKFKLPKAVLKNLGIKYGKAGR